MILTHIFCRNLCLVKSRSNARSHSYRGGTKLSKGGVTEGTRGARRYFFLPALAADFVILPVFSTFSTSLMTPTATVCFMSRTAKRPRGWYSENFSTHMGLDGMKTTMAASPLLMNLGLSSSFFPDRRSIFSLISENLQAMCEVWQSSTGE